MNRVVFNTKYFWVLDASGSKHKDQRGNGQTCLVPFSDIMLLSLSDIMLLNQLDLNQGMESSDASCSLFELSLLTVVSFRTRTTQRSKCL